MPRFILEVVKLPNDITFFLLPFTSIFSACSVNWVGMDSLMEVRQLANSKMVASNNIYLMVNMERMVLTQSKILILNSLIINKQGQWNGLAHYLFIVIPTYKAKRLGE